ncbi:LOW QUALITY PROTEIN: DegT/DnrJ/EryC1/StrS aminotransferase [Caldithrix abyssi DSM 13497]|uniref:GDP-perosamine synthase n=1 Tax=Caldithrix abyssi DSM 13497 TaxID=880073 RepID=H1XWL8_CALAY|nr:LOW QUALITY PROTEIN: DegT/DnrJ/EryC1/StrS aminotransferase [Caldithrix abyssi DSM 13497]
MKKRIYLSPPHMSGEELKLVIDAFESNWIAPLGPHVDAFEREVANYIGVQHAAALSSGTAAIHLALILLGVEQGNEVICQSFTFSGSANPIVYQRALPVFVDSETDTWNMDPELLEEAIKDRMAKGKKTQSVIVVHLYGQPAKMDEIMAVCRQYEIPVIEDAAEALGSSYKGKKAGSFGQLAILSFNGNKIITTSGGGMLLSNDEQKIKSARFLATQARDDAPHYEHSQIGYNYRMSNILAAIGRGQLKVLERRVQKKRSIFEFYHKRLAKYEGISFQPELDHTHSNRWLTCMVIDPQNTKTTHDEIRLLLDKYNIESRPLWKPMHLQPVFKGAPAYCSGVAERLFKHGLCLPSGTALKEQQLDQICALIESLL